MPEVPAGPTSLATVTPAPATGSRAMYTGYETWRMDVAKCVQFRIGNKAGSSCGRCIKVCPWNRRDTWHHRLSIAGAARSKVAQRALIKLDEMLKSNLRPEPEDRWWRIEDFADVPEGGFAVDEKAMIKAP